MATLPDWVIDECRSMSCQPARWMLVELFFQGARVRARGGVEYMVWNEPLEALHACSSGSVNAAKSELVERGLLIELPGVRTVNGRPRSAWMVPLVLEVCPGPGAEYTGAEHDSILSPAPEHASILSVAQPVSNLPLAGKHASILSDAPEHASILSDAVVYKGRRVGAAPGAQYSSSSSSGARASSSSSSIRDATQALGSREQGTGSSTRDSVSVAQDSRTLEQPEGGSWAVVGTAVALAGLRHVKVRRPEDVLRQVELNSVLGALREYVEAQEAHQAEPGQHPVVVSPSGFVMSRVRAVYEPVSEFGFAGWWER